MVLMLMLPMLMLMLHCADAANPDCADPADPDCADADADAANADCANDDGANSDAADAEADKADSEEPDAEPDAGSDTDELVADTKPTGADLDHASEAEEDVVSFLGNNDGRSIHTPSPHNQGAFRIAGGILRGHAKGNVFSFVDDQEHVVEAQAPIVGRVLVYESRLTGAEPSFSMKQQVTPSLKDVLLRLGEKQSPI